MKQTTPDTCRRVIQLLLSGRTYREITDSCNVSTKTIVKINKRMKELNGANFGEMQDDQLMALFFCQDEGVTKNGLEIPDRSYICRQMFLYGKNKRETWEGYVSQCSGKYMKYSKFCAYLEEHKQEYGLDVICKPGEEMIVIWCSKKARIVDRHTGELKEFPVVIGIWPFSGWYFISCLPRKDFESWLDAHVSILSSAGCVPHKIIPVGYRGIYGKGKDLQDQYCTLSYHYGCKIMVKADGMKDFAQKADAEVAEWLGTECFYSKEEAERKFMSYMKNKTQNGFCVYELFHNREIPSGYDLPANEFCVERWKEAKVQYMCHIAIERKYYSVPWRYLGKTVKVKLTRDHVEIFYEEKRIAIHARLYGEKAWYATDPAHMPPYGANVEWNKDRFLSMARKIGPSTYQVIKINLEIKEIEQQMYFDCRMILKFSSDYTPELLELACCTLLENHMIPWRKNIEAQIGALSTMPMHIS